MSELKEKMQVVMLPTEKASNIAKGKILRYITDFQAQWIIRPDADGSIIPQHLYIISNKEIKNEGGYILGCKVGDFIIWENKVRKITHVGEPFNFKGTIQYDNEDRIVVSFNDIPKIEASTDKSLGLPEPSIDFIKKYVEKQGDIKEVMVEMEVKPWEKGMRTDQIITQLKVRPDNTIIISKVDDSAEKIYQIWKKMEDSPLKQHLDKWFSLVK